MSNPHTAIVTESVLQSVLLDSADYQKLHDGLKQKLDIDMSVEELKKIPTYHQLFIKLMQKTK